MFTPQELQNKKFAKAVFGGYDMREVDDFLDAVIADYEQLYKDTAVLKGKLKVLAEKVEEYRSVDDEMRKTLFEAKKSAETMLSDAEKNSKELTLLSRTKAENEIKSLREEIKREQGRLELARVKTSAYVEEVTRTYGGFVKSLSSLEAVNIAVEKERTDDVASAVKDIESSIKADRAEIRVTSEELTADSGLPEDAGDRPVVVLFDDKDTKELSFKVPTEKNSREINVGGMSITVTEDYLKNSDGEKSIADIFGE
ncbi:MAG: DivIVA domain-containing protein [Oscillospiraceae bacterium]|nr:DivIVA domain-containing protein [Oscillospiraceae bacterium]